MKKLIQKVIPEAIWNIYRVQKTKLKVIVDYIYDYNRFMKFSASLGLKNRDHMQAYLIKEYHAVEKGLALRSPKPGFGVERISRFIGILELYENKFGADFITDISISTLKEYLDFDVANNNQVNPLVPIITKTLERYNERTKVGGTRKVYKSEVIAGINLNFDHFFKSRYSVRDFAETPVDLNLIMEAIETAAFTPSVCNRQPWKVYLVDGSNQAVKEKFLAVQNGNKGFGEQISSLLVVTGKLSSFFPYERNQIFIDGGMFSMSLVLALHAKGLGTCCLNNSFTAKENKAFMKVIKMDQDAVPIMYIAVGHLKSEYKVAISERKPVREMVEIL